MAKATVCILLFFLLSAVSIYGQNCLQFDGTNDFITIDNQLSVSGDYTIEAWFYSQTSGEQNILSATNINNQHGVIVAIDSGNRYRFLHRDPSGSSGERNLRVSASNFVNSWHHIAAVFDGSNTFLYLDGTEIGSLTNANAFSSSMDIAIGRLSPINSVRYFNGLLDEVRIWNIARTQAEIQAVMNTELSGDELGLVAYYPFNQESGDVLDDATANGNDGTLYNFTLPDAWVTSTAPNHFPPGNYLAFDGLDDYVDIPNTDLLDLTDDMTIEFWVRFDSLPYDSQCLFAKGDWNSDAYSMVLSSDNLLKFHTGSMTLEYNWDDLVADDWNHVAVACNGDSTKIYINGDKKVAYREGTIYANTETLRLGGSSGQNAYPLMGGIDEFRVWNVVRTQQQIYDNRYKQPLADEPGLVLYYRFDQGNAGENNTSLSTEVIDHTNTHHGILNNFAMTGDSSNWLASGYDAALVLSTTRVHNVTGATADVNAEIYKTGSTIVSVRGVCYSATNNSPTTDDSTIEEVNPGGISAGEYTTSLSGLGGNTQYYARAFASNEVETIYGETRQFITHTSPNAPDIQACDIVFSHITPSQAAIAWTNGNGYNRVVFLLQGDAGVAALNDNTTYTASSIFGQGDEIGNTGWYCVYNGPDSSVTVTGLVANTPYRVMVCEYYNSSGSEIYNTGTAHLNPENTSMSQFHISMYLSNFFLSGDIDWGDYDNDGDLDLLAVGGMFIVSKVFQNNGGSFSDLNAGLMQLAYGSVAWGDYDNDGDLDILLSGVSYNDEDVSIIYQNNDGFFNDINAGLLGVSYGSTAWGDYDNDGDLDIVITGKNRSIGSISRIYRNDDGIFTDIDAGLIDVEESCVEWGDYDNDGDLDLLLTGTSTGGGVAIIYRNDGGIFTDTDAGLLGVTKSGAAWGDYDNDGDLDIFILGYNELNTAMSKIYRNDGGIFADIHADLANLANGDVAWGDYDNDGDLDILLSGEHANNDAYSFVYRNDDGVFTDIEAGLDALTESKVDWADYDNDGDLDFMLCGSYYYQGSALLCRNNMGTNTFFTNTAPDAPTNFEVSLSDDEYVCSWNASADAQTPVEGLTYNLQVGYSSEGTDIVSPMAQLSDGWRMITARGSQNHNTQWTLSSLPLRYQVDCVGRVQAIDGGYMGSSFSTEDTFCLYPELVNEEELTPEGVLSWETQPQFLEIIDGYQVQIDVTTAFANPIVDQFVYPEIGNRSEAQNSRTGALAKETTLVMLSTSSTDTVQRTNYYSMQLNQLANYVDLVGDTVYYWRTRPIYSDSVATVFTVEEKSFTYVAGNSAPNPPTDGFNPANDNPVSSLTPIIFWNAATDPDLNDTPDLLRYVVELDTLDVFAAPVVTDSTTIGNTYIQLENQLISGYRYYYRVKTIDDDDAESEWSVTQQFVTLLPPQNITIARGNEEVTLFWEPIAMNLGNMFYTVYSTSDSEAAFPDEWVVEAANLSVTSWQDTDVTSPMKFYVVTVGSTTGSVSTDIIWKW